MRRYRIDRRYYVEAENGTEAIQKVEDGESKPFSLCCAPVDVDVATAARETIVKNNNTVEENSGRIS